MVTAVQALFVGDAAADVMAGLTANNLNSVNLANAINARNASTVVSNAVATAKRPQTGIFSTDSFVFPGNAPGTTYPGFKTTAIPWTGGTVGTAFGAWDSTNTTFTFSKSGVFQVTAFIPLAFQGGTNINGGPGCVLGIMTNVTTSGALTSHLVGVANMQLVPGSWQGASIQFTKTVSDVLVGTTLNIAGIRTRYNSSDSTDLVVTNINDSGSLSSWVEIIQIR